MNQPQKSRAGLLRGLALVCALVPAIAIARPSAPPDGPPKGEPGAQGKKEGGKQDDFPPFQDVAKDYDKVVSTADGQESLYTVWTRKKDGQVLAELPKDFERQKLFIATTIAGGAPTAGIHFGDSYVYWKRYNKRLALIEPNVSVRSTGDAESKSSRDQLFTDRVLLDVPIVAMGPGGGPVIDMDELLVGQATKFFGNLAKGIQGGLASISSAKAFPQNVEIAMTAPLSDGRLTTLHYSISLFPENTGYEPRVADERVGYFTTTWLDLGRPQDDRPYTRYINRWKLDKADPGLTLSPPKQPIVFYIDHTTPVRYRRWVRDGVLEWNKAFEKVGVINAIEVYQQDKPTGAHMDKDPEDVRYNFIRWNSNGQSFAIGPSRVDPRTGQILDADVVMNDGWIRAYALQWQRLIPEIAMEGFAPETLAWLDQRPQWDPRLRMASPMERQQLLAERAHRLATGASPHPAAQADPTMMGDDAYDGLAHRVSQLNGACQSAICKSLDIALVRFSPDLLDAAMAAGIERKPRDGDAGDKDGKDGDEPRKDLLDGVPESFIGPLIKDVVMHEVGHTLGLRHNFKASMLVGIDEMNSEPFKGKAQTASVMDYNPVNINFKDGPVQGDWCMTSLGPYDYWAIEYGYTSSKDLKPILARSSEPANNYGTDEDTWGPDPRARRYDFGADPLAYAESQMRLVQHLRSQITGRIVKDGDSWSKARDAYLAMLARQINAVSVAANWVGGSYVSRARKGDDPDNRAPVVSIPPDSKRKALKFVCDNALRDEAYGLTPDLLSRMTVDKWWDDGGIRDIFEDPTWPVHERVLGVQASALTMVLNPTTLRRVLDDELRTPSGQDAVTVAEVMQTIGAAVWTEIDSKPDGRASARQPVVSSLRRNLQREHVERLIDLTFPGGFSGGASSPVATLAAQQLRDLHAKLKSYVDSAGSRLDPYTLAHLNDSRVRIEKALDAQYVYNARDIAGSLSDFRPRADQPQDQRP